jgi:hypothetical protein
MRKGKLARVLGDIYKQLKIYYDSEFTPNDERWERLKEEKWILVESDDEPVFARPSEIFGEIPKTFPGYFYKMPLDFEYRRYASQR